MTPINLLALVKGANKGDFIEYYKGCLVTNQTRQKRFLRRTAFLLYEEGLVLLIQKRLGDNLSVYYMVRTSNPFRVTNYTVNKIGEMSK